MRTIAILILIAAAILGITLFVNRPAQAPASGKPLICATIAPLADWLRDIAGPDADVHLLVDGTKDPHHFEPSVQDAVHVASAKAFFAIGLGLDPWADKLVDKSGVKLAYFEVGSWIQPRPLNTPEIELGQDPTHKKEPEPHVHKPGEAHDHHEHDHGANDPHFWHDPQRALVVVQRAALELAAIDPAHKDNYAARAAECALKLQALDQKITALAATIPAGKKIVTFHDAYGYLFERLHVQIAAVVQSSPGVEPSLKDCAEAIRIMREIKQTAVYKEPNGSDKAIETIAKNLNITQIEILDPLDNESSPCGKNYFERMEFNLSVLQKTLK